MAVVMGTAGHIDHGKTSLVKALTGTDCDRLEEEKKRGITIELGFAFLPLPDGTRLGIVDVPGHERFIHNMVAGASGIDFVLMVIAADEGVMPQTREHLEICSLMGIRDGLVALTKADMVDEDMLELAREDVADAMKGTFLEGAPVIPVSAMTGDGIESLRLALQQKAASLRPRHHSDILRLPVDRVFSIKGYGTIVTGTLVSGKARPDDEIEIVPSGVKARVKSIQSHGEDVAIAEPGHRISMNLSGLEVKDIRKGDIISRRGALFPTEKWLVALRCLPGAPRGIRQREEVHFHYGTREVQAKIYFADRDTLQPGESALAEVRFGEPMAAVLGDHCVVRMFSPLRTAAGGIVLNAVPYSCKLRRISEEMRRRLLALPDATDAERVLTQVAFAGQDGVNWAKLAVLTCLEEKRMDKACQELTREHKIYCFHKDTRSFVSAEALEAWKSLFLQRAAAFHSRHPLEKGMSRGWLFSGVEPEISMPMGMFVLNQLLREEKIVADGDILRLAGFAVEMQVDEEELSRRILAAHRAEPMSPPMLRHFLEAENLTEKQVLPVLKMLVQKGELVKAGEDLYYDAGTMEDIKDRVRSWFGGHSDMTPADLKEITGLTRKYVIPLLEYFDNSHFTMRVGNERRLRRV